MKKQSGILQGIPRIIAFILVDICGVAYQVYTGFNFIITLIMVLTLFDIATTINNLILQGSQSGRHSSTLTDEERADRKSASANRMAEHGEILQQIGGSLQRIGCLLPIVAVIIGAILWALLE